MDRLEWRKPYAVKSSGVWPFRRHAITFDGDTEVVISTSDHELAARIVGGLNGAYNLGRSSAILDMEFSTEGHHDAR